MATTAKPNTTKSSAPKASAATKATSAPAAPAGGAAVRKTLTDAGYIAVGLGVLGIQQVSSRRQKLAEQIHQATSDLTERAKKSGEQIQALPNKLGEQLGTLRTERLGDVRSRIDTARERAGEIGEQTRERVTPVIDRVEARVGDLPTPLPQAAKPVVQAARQLVSA